MIDLFQNSDILTGIRTQLLRTYTELIGLSHRRKCELGVVQRPHYGYCAYYAGVLAERLDEPRVSLIELGVGDGAGLRSLESHVDLLEEELDVCFEIHGFDTGQGLPSPRKVYDLPYCYGENAYAMDVDEVRASLDRAQLHLGDVAETIPEFVEAGCFAPIGTVFFDLDYYTSTRDALALFDAPPKQLFPRVTCYFDNITSDPLIAFNENTAELRAIKEFDATRSNQTLTRISLKHSLRHNENIRPHCLFTYQDFSHPQYETPIWPTDD